MGHLTPPRLSVSFSQWLSKRFLGDNEVISSIFIRSFISFHPFALRLWPKRSYQLFHCLYKKTCGWSWLFIVASKSIFCRAWWIEITETSLKRELLWCFTAFFVQLSWPIGTSGFCSSGPCYWIRMGFFSSLMQISQSAPDCASDQLSPISNAII